MIMTVKNNKKLLGVIMFVLMLALVVPITALAFPTNTLDGIVSDEEYDYYHRYIFDNVAVDTSNDNSGLPGNALGSPFGFAHESSTPAKVRVGETGKSNYVRLTYPADKTGGDVLSNFYMSKDGKSYILGNAVSFEFDIRWQGVTDTTLISDDHVMNLLYARCLGNSGHNFTFLKAKVVADETVADKYLEIFIADDQKVVTLEKGSADFTNIKVVYYSATQTFSVFVNGAAVVEARSCVDGSNKRLDIIGLGSHSTGAVSYDGIISTREISDINHHPYFVFGHVGYSETFRTPFVIDIDNLYVKDAQVADGRTPYYENSFEGSIGDLVTSSLTATDTVTYGYNSKDEISVGTESNGESENTYLDMTHPGRFLIKDRYQVLQNGNWTIEFDARVTSTHKEFSLLRMADGVNNNILLFVTTDGTIRFGSLATIMKTIVPNTQMATYESGEWTHIALSITVDRNGTNMGLYDDWTGSAGASGLCYGMSLWVDGVYVGSSNNVTRQEFAASSSSKVTFINDAAYTREALTSAPTVPDSNAENIKWLKNSDTLKQYVDESTGILYYLQYDADGNFITGSLNSDKTASGSVKLTPGVADSGVNSLAFFDNRSETYSNGAIDNLKIYKGVYPAANAVGKNDLKGTVAEIDLGYVISPVENMVKATQNSAGGEEGVVYFENWWRGSTAVPGGTVTYKTESDNTYVKFAADSETYLDVYTPNVGGKVFSSQITLKDFSLTTGSASLLSVKRQAADGTQKVLNTLMADSSGNIYFTKGTVNCYLSDKNGTKYSIKGTDWITLETIIDETGDTPLISYRVNGEVAYYSCGSIPCQLKAVNIVGVVTDEIVALKNAPDQRVCILQFSDATISVGLDTFKVELVENPFSVEEYEWTDEVMIDFSDYKSIEELGPQFYWTHAENENVEIRNGVLYVPKGATFGWVDMNGAFQNFLKTNGSDSDGYNIEIKAKTSTEESYLVRAVCDDGTTNGIIRVRTNGDAKSIVVGGGGLSDGKITPIGNGKFTDITATFWKADNQPTFFMDGAVVGRVIANTGTAVGGKELVAFEVASGTEVSELYIHRDLKSELAQKSGNLITVDPNVVSTTISENPPQNGMAMGALTEANIQTDDEGYKYYSINYETPSTASVMTDIPLTGYLEDHVSVFETEVRFVPSQVASDDSPNIKLIQLLKNDASGQQIAENLIQITPEGYLFTPYGYLLDKDGALLMLSAEDWQNIAVIYDADSGQISYRVDGAIPYYKEGSSIVIAHSLQNQTPRNYRIDAVKTTARTVYMPENFVGKLELKCLKTYIVNESANIEFIGTQVSTSDGDIRIIAGIDMLYYGSAGFDIKAYDADGTLLSVEEKSILTNTAYSSIIEDLGTTTNTVYPEDYGYRYFLLGAVTGIPQRELAQAVKLEITPFTIVNSTKSYSSKVLLDVDFTELNMNNWICSTDFIKVKPRGDNINANFSTTEYVSYTNDGSLELNGLNAEFAFGASCEGQVSIDLANSFGEVATASLFDVYVNGVLTKENVEVPFGHHTFVLAEDLVKGDYTFKLVKKSGGDFVRINSMNFCGTIGDAPLLVRENAIDVVVSAPKGTNEYGDITLYMESSYESKESDEFEGYYIRYDIPYQKSGVDPNASFSVATSVQLNRSLYRITNAYVVKKLSDFTYSEPMFQILSGGEISLAMAEKGAVDYVGGFHGDEHIKNIEFYLDGVEIDTSKAGTYIGSQFEWIQDTVMNRCNTPDENIMNHVQRYLITSKGIKLEQQVEFISDDYTPNSKQNYLQMAPYNCFESELKAREDAMVAANELTEEEVSYDDVENLICTKTNLLDANGGINAVVDVANKKVTDKDNIGYAYNRNSGWAGTDYSNRYAEYIGGISGGNFPGLYGLIGFVIDDASVYPEHNALMMRSDNKWYASFDTCSSKDVVTKGEVWNVSNSYFIDYNPDLYVVEVE